MYKIYFKQALKMLRQNQFISIVSILGTAVAIMMIMTIVVSDEVKNASVAPETNRHRTYYIDYEMQHDTASNHKSLGTLSYSVIHEYLLDLEIPELTAFYFDTYKSVGTSPSKENSIRSVKLTNDAYWKALSYSFVAGRTFTKEEYESGMKHAIITESLSKKMFKGENPIGQEISIDLETYRIIGVVKDVSPLFTHAYANVWVPITSDEDYNDSRCTLMLVTASDKDYPALYEEIRNQEKRFNADKAPKTLFLKGPENQRIHTLQPEGSSIEEVKESINIQSRKMAFIVLVLLIVPAINLSGFSLSRIRKRMSEIGVRKAFGAKKHVILIQVLYENLITSLIGGLLGLIFSYFIVLNMREWLLGISSNSEVPISTLVSPWIFAAVFFVCLILNLLSAGIPAYRASRISIINSLNQNEQPS